MSALYHTRHLPELTSEDRSDLENILRDRFQSQRARKRALGMLLLADRAIIDEVTQRTGMNGELLAAMLVRFKKSGIAGAVFGVERDRSKRKYDVKAIEGALRVLVTSRPPEGIYWSIRALVNAVIAQVPEAEGVSCEYVRQIMVKKLGILSVRHIEPFWLRQVRSASAAA